jgi:hypothetical protein
MPLATTSSVGGIMLGIGVTKFLREDGTWQNIPPSGITAESDPIFVAHADVPLIYQYIKLGISYSWEIIRAV